MDNQICGFLKERVWAVVGASANPDKFGYKIYKLLTKYGYKVYPVNPKETEIEGQPCYDSLAALPEKPGAVDVVVPPAVAAEVAAQCAGLGIAKVWFQPGTANDAVVEAAGKLGLDFVHHNCVMVQSTKLHMIGRRVWAVACDGKDGKDIAPFLSARGHVAYVVAAASKTPGEYSVIKELPVKPEAVVICGTESFAAAIIEDAAKVGVPAVWLEPGTETDALIHQAVAAGMTVVHHAPLMEEYAAIAACRPGTPVR